MTKILFWIIVREDCKKKQKKKMSFSKLNIYASNLVHLLSKSGGFTYKKWVLRINVA